MLADLRLDQVAHMRLDAFVGAFLIGTHQARIPDHIGGEDCSEAAVHPIRRSSLHGVLPSRVILYRGTPMRTTGEGPLSTQSGGSRRGTRDAENHPLMHGGA